MYTLQLDRCMCTILTRHASINQIKSHWKTSEGEKQAYICCMFVEGKSRTVFFPSDTLIYGICRDGTKNNNIRAYEHLILGQFRMGARSAIYAPLGRDPIIAKRPFAKTCNHVDDNSDGGGEGLHNDDNGEDKVQQKTYWQQIRYHS